MMRLTRRLANPTPWVRVDRSGEVRSREYKLIVREGPDAGQARTLEGPVVIGTGPDAQFQLSDPAISSAHLELTPRAGGIQLKDLGSTNGTFLGNARVTEAFLEKVTTLRIGETTLELDVIERTVGLSDGPTRFGDAYGESQQMRQLFGVLSRIAPSDSPVILLGETGVGKEVLARAIHDHSQRRTGPFVIFDCGSVAATLIESELFGHVRGAFTGASSDRQGAFSQADHGTLFLDELGELPLDLQSRLLRALEAGTIRRLGEDHYRQVDVRIIAATHRNLEEQAKAGRFRQDLYFRLAVATVRVPPLRERLDDLPGLVHRLLHVLGRPDFELSAGLIERLKSYSWPGNVRELRNVVSRALLGEEPLTHQPTERPTTTRDKPDLELPFKEAKERLVDNFTRDYLAAMLAKHGGNITRTAEAAGLARPYLHKLVVKYGLAATD